MSSGRGSDDWRSIDRVFAAALDRPPDDRTSFVDTACRGDPDLRREVRALLDSCRRAEPFLEIPLITLGGGLWPDVPDAAPHDADRRDEMVGRFRIVRALARGGMGTVFLAERADGEFEQRVALKLLRRGLDSEDLLARFRVERQILASLDHPHIARLIDGGASDDGRPYLVMEYVEGRPITDYCEGRRLGVKDRLRLFAAVARAVAYAHRNLVIHRDLKPSNILVTEAGTPKLLDFGIAKLLDRPGETPHTRTGFRLMTPEYASPEQLRGEPVTTASDVYQLGLLLYRLLTGKRPFPAGASRSAPGRVQDTAEPTRPSAAVHRGPASRQLHGDLDNITLMALRGEPDRRYPSVAQLAEDVERHLAGLPVTARGDGVGYRFRKFVSRHKAGVGAAAMFLLMLIGYAVTVTVQSRLIAFERDRVRVEAAKAVEVKDFLIGLFEVADPGIVPEEPITAREILDRGADRIRRELEGQPAVRAELLSAIGQIYGQLEMSEHALSLAQEALSIRRELFGPNEPEVAASLLQVAKLRSVWRIDVDSMLLLEAVDAARGAHGADHPLYAEALFNLAYYVAWPGESGAERTAATLDRAISILRDHSDEPSRALLAEILTASAYGKGDAPEALGRMREALEIRRSLYGDEHPVVAQSLSDIALAIEQASPGESIRLLQEAVEIYRQLGGETHPMALRLANNLAGVLRDNGELAEAEALYREVLQVRRDAGHDLAHLAYSLYGLGRTLVARGEGGEAEPYLREVLPAFPEGDARRDLVLDELERALASQKR
jgi:serine/threonine-protein kinase